MNEIVNTFLLFGDEFMPEMHLRQPLDLLIVHVGHLLKMKKEFKIKKKQEILVIFTKMN